MKPYRPQRENDVTIRSALLMAVEILGGKRNRYGHFQRRRAADVLARHLDSIRIRNAEFCKRRREALKASK